MEAEVSTNMARVAKDMIGDTLWDKGYRLTWQKLK
jgi:hypothetical protein